MQRGVLFVRLAGRYLLLPGRSAFSVHSPKFPWRHSHRVGKDPLEVRQGAKTALCGYEVDLLIGGDKLELGVVDLEVVQVFAVGNTDLFPEGAAEIGGMVMGHTRHGLKGWILSEVIVEIQYRLLDGGTGRVLFLLDTHVLQLDEQTADEALKQGSIGMGTGVLHDAQACQRLHDGRVLS